MRSARCKDRDKKLHVFEPSDSKPANISLCVFMTKRDKASGKWRKLHNEKLHDF